MKKIIESGIKICVYCNKEILKKERAVQLRTFEDDKTIEDIYFHLTCYKDWHDKRALEKAQNNMRILYKRLKDGGVLEQFREIMQDGNKTH